MRVDDDLRNLFTKEISFTLPNYKQRYLFFKREITDDLKLTLDEIHVKSFAQQTEGLNYAQLEEIIRNALRKIERKTLNERIQEQINLLTHAIIGDCDLPQDHQKLIAAYLAGQVLVHHVLKSPFEFEFVTLGKLSIKEKDDNKCGKIVKFGPSQERESINIEGHKKLAQVLFAGPLAEDIFSCMILLQHITSMMKKEHSSMPKSILTRSNVNVPIVMTIRGLRTNALCSASLKKNLIP